MPSPFVISIKLFIPHNFRPFFVSHNKFHFFFGYPRFLRSWNAAMTKIWCSTHFHTSTTSAYHSHVVCLRSMTKTMTSSKTSLITCPPWKHCDWWMLTQWRAAPSCAQRWRTFFSCIARNLPLSTSMVDLSCVNSNVSLWNAHLCSSIYLCNAHLQSWRVNYIFVWEFDVIVCYSIPFLTSNTRDEGKHVLLYTSDVRWQKKFNPNPIQLCHIVFWHTFWCEYWYTCIGLCISILNLCEI